MIRSRLRVTDSFPVVTERVDQLAQRAVSAAAQEGAKVASVVASERTRTGAMARMHVHPVEGDVDGWRAGFSSEASITGQFYAGYQDDGTVAGRRRAVSDQTLRRRRSASGAARFARASRSQGIKALGFFAKGRSAGRAKLRSVVKGGL